MERRIAMSNAISPSDTPVGFSLTIPSISDQLGETMNYPAIMTPECDDVPHPEFRRRYSIDKDAVAGVNRGHHAGAGCARANAAESSRHFRRKLTTERAVGFHRVPQKLALGELGAQSARTVGRIDFSASQRGNLKDALKTKSRSPVDFFLADFLRRLRRAYLRVICHRFDLPHSG
jgi:hypothetical protein